MRTTVVETAYGLVRGVDDGRVTAWKGVRYAAPPTGELRWRGPGGERGGATPPPRRVNCGGGRPSRPSRGARSPTRPRSDRYARSRWSHAFRSTSARHRAMTA